MTDERRCTHCGGGASPAARFCPHCGMALAASQHATDSEALYKKGDFIGQKYEVYGTLGKGGFGIVYLVYSRELKAALALKTFQDKYLPDAHVRLAV
ncbi:MAG: hypothetical protein WBZ42_02815 [Halobacteriota archaeon]